MPSDEAWFCTNPACTSVKAATATHPAESPAPLCSCGSRMKKKYRSPVFRYLDFLRLDEPEAARTALHREPRD